MKTYKIKLEDKAAFLNRLDKAGIPAESYNVVDNKFEGYFEFTTSDPVTDKMVGTILRQSPKINRLKEMLRTLVREELQNDNLKIDKEYKYKGNKVKYLGLKNGYYYFNTFRDGKIDDVTRLEKKDLIDLS